MQLQLGCKPLTMKGKMKTKVMEQLSNEGKVYELKVGELNVEIIYSKKQIKIDECILNILKRKSN